MAREVGGLNFGNDIPAAPGKEDIGSPGNTDKGIQIRKRQTAYRQLCTGHLGRLLLADALNLFFPPRC